MSTLSTTTIDDIELFIYKNINHKHFHNLNNYEQSLNLYLNPYAIQNIIDLTANNNNGIESCIKINVYDNISNTNNIDKLKDIVCIICPIGSEWKYKYYYHDGRVNEIYNNFNNTRIYICYLSRLYNFNNFIYKELKSSILPLIKQTLPIFKRDKNIQFITLDNKYIGNELGNRKLLQVYNSIYAGKIYVEDVIDYSINLDDSNKSDDNNKILYCDIKKCKTKIIRRMIFDSDEAAIQSESYIYFPSDYIARSAFSDFTSDASLIATHDWSSLSFEYHHAILCSLTLFEPLMRNITRVMNSNHHSFNTPNPFKLLFLGLGAGILANCFSQVFHYQYIRMVSADDSLIPNTPVFNIEAVELDPVVVEIASKWFNSGNFPIHLMDAIEFIFNLYEKVCTWSRNPPHNIDPRIDILVVDIDNKDLNDKILSFPPHLFISKTFLNLCYSCIRPDGLLLINCGVHKNAMLLEIVSKLQVNFDSVYEIAIDGNQNKILIATVGDHAITTYPIIEKSKVYEIDDPLEISGIEDDEDSDDGELDNAEIIEDLISKNLPNLVCVLPPNCRDNMLAAMTKTLECLDLYLE